MLILGQTSSLIENYSLKFTLSMYVLEQTGYASVFAGLMTVSLFPTILLSPFGGFLADWTNRRNIMVSLDALSVLSVLLSSRLLPLGNEITVIGLLLVILSALGAFESPTVQTSCRYTRSCLYDFRPGRILQSGKICRCVPGTVSYETIGIPPPETSGESVIQYSHLKL